jgi:predicted dehydrogenase
MTSRIYKAAVAGCGMAGSDYDSHSSIKHPKSHAGAYKKDPRFDLVAAADISADALRRFGNKWEVSGLYLDVEEMLKKEKPDVLSITSSTESHIPILRKALNSSVKVIFMEKPVSHSLSEAIEIYPDVIRSGKKIMVNYTRRWNKNNILIKEWIEQGKMGSLVKAVLYYTVGIIHNGSHGIDLIRWYFGEFDGVMGIGNIETGFDQIINARYKLKNGGDFILEGFARKNWNIWELDILMENGRIKFSRGGRIIERWMPTADSDFPKLKVFESVEFPYENDWPNTLSNAVDSIFHVLEDDTPIRCSYYDGLAALGWGVSAIGSAKAGGQWRYFECNEI